MPRRKKSGREPSLGGLHPADQSPQLGGDASVLHLVEMLGHKDRRVRERAIDALAQSGRGEAVAALVERLRTARAYGLRRRIIQALANVPGDVALDAILSRAEDREESVRAAVIEALQKRADDPRVIPVLVRAFDNREGVRIVYSAAEALARTGDAGCARILLDAARSASGHQRYAAIAVIWRLQTPEVLPILTDNMRSAAHVTVAIAAAHSLAKTRLFEATQALIDALRDPSPMVRQAAAFGLGRVPRLEEAVAALLNTLDDPDPWVRQSTVIALGELRAVEAVGPLVQLVGVELDASLQGALFFALGRIGSSKAIDALERFGEQNPTLVEASLRSNDSPEARAALRRVRARQRQRSSADA